jgi:hypothetical protein
MCEPGNSVVAAKGIHCCKVAGCQGNRESRTTGAWRGLWGHTGVRCHPPIIATRLVFIVVLIAAITPFLVLEDQTVAEAEQIMLDAKVAEVPVVTREKLLVGTTNLEAIRTG